MTTMYRPTQSMAIAAKKGIKLRGLSAKSNQGGTSIGLARARQFITRTPVSLDIVKRTYSFLSRARVYYQPGKNTPGTQAYLLWGGPTGLAWAKSIIDEINKEK